MQYLNLLLLSLLFACTETTSQKENLMVNTENYQWRKILDEGPWTKNYNFQMFSIKDTLWVFHPDGTWYSSDGTSWAKSPLQNVIQNLAFLDYVPFNGGITGIGSFKGNIEQYTFKPDVYHSKDMKKWQRFSSTPPERFFYHPFVFQDKLWFIGGEDKNRLYGDVWNSSDGVQWEKIKEKLPFGNRSGSQVVQLNNRLILFNNDVWISDDAVVWKMLSREIVKGEQLFGYTALVFDDKIWLLGCTRNGQFTSRVLYSEDGIHWTGQDAPWSNRGGVAACVHRGKIYMTGGKFGGQDIQHPEFEYSNDLWVLEKITP